MKEALLVIDGVEYKWSIYRQPQWCGSDGWKGQALQVELAIEPSRRLIIEFPFISENRRSTPQRQRPTPDASAVAFQISSALEAAGNHTLAVSHLSIQQIQYEPYLPHLFVSAKA